MRVTFSVILLSCFASAAALATLSASPTFSGVLFETVDSWFVTRLGVNAVGGAVLGIVWGLLARKYVLIRPAEANSSYRDRVLRRGLVGMLVAVVLAAVHLVVTAGIASFVPLSPTERILELCLSLKGAGALLAVVPSFGLAWGTTIRYAPHHRHWGGARSLLP
ncbi:MAG: hypothetical protein RH859_09420 [Longimicrobiales bacterium]